jgi:outer membrane protein TolC
MPTYGIAGAEKKGKASLQTSRKTVLFCNNLARSRRCRPASIFFLLLLFSAVSHAERPSVKSAKAQPAQAHSMVEKRVPLRSLLEEAIANNPELLAVFHKAKAADAATPQKGALPDPMIGLMSTNMSSPVPFTTIGREPQANAGVSVSQEIPFPGKRSLKETIASKEAEGYWHEFAATRLRVLSRVKAVVYEIVFLDKAKEILFKSKQNLIKLARIAQAQYEVGKTSQQDLLKARVEVSILEAKLLDIIQKRKTSVAELNTLLHRDPNAQLPSIEPLGVPVVLVPFSKLQSALKENNPILKTKRVDVERSGLEVNSKKLDYYPDVVVGGYYGYAGDLPDMWQFRLDFKVPLYFWQKQRYGVEESKSRLSQSKSEKDVTLQELKENLTTLYTRAKTSEKLVSLYHAAIIPDGALTIESSLQGYQTGKVDFLNVLTNVLSQYNYELAYIEEVMNLQKIIAQIEELTNIEFESWDNEVKK